MKIYTILSEEVFLKSLSLATKQGDMNSTGFNKIKGS